MTVRSPESMRDELEYWMCAITDVQELNLLASDVSVRLGRIALSLALTHDIEAAVIRIDKAIDYVAKMDEPIGRMLSLIEGRQLALQAEKVA